VIDLLVRVVINAAALIVASLVLKPHVQLTIGSKLDDWVKIALITLLFALINTYLRPIVKLISLPISLLTMGLVGLVINAAMLLVLAAVSRTFDLPFAIEKFPPTLNADAIVWAFVAGILISIVATLLSMALSSRKVLGVPL
jgi:putative membrane protein